MDTESAAMLAELEGAWTAYEQSVIGTHGDTEGVRAALVNLRVSFAVGYKTGYLNGSRMAGRMILGELAGESE
jgi:hypothetical protein